MYDELVKSLRVCGKALEDAVYPDWDFSLYTKSADAIEELQKAVLRLEEASGILDELPMYQQPVGWIPVTERLPEEYVDVLCYYEYYRYGEYNCMWRTIDRGYYGNGIWGGEAGQGHRNKVLAWMPLPQPPKEGEL